MFGRDSRAGVRAGAGNVLGRHCRDLRDGTWHRDHGRDHRRHRGDRQGFARRLSGARDGKGTVILRFVEFAAAGLVLLLGVGLLLGYTVAERAVCF